MARNNGGLDVERDRPAYQHAPARFGEGGGGNGELEIVEVGPRDGLQNEEAILGTDSKLELVHRLSESGLRRMEVASFAHPRLVPQVADAEDLVAGLSTESDLALVGIVLNRRGLDRALATQIHELNFVIPVTEAFCRRNQRVGLEDLVEEIESELIGLAHAGGRRATVTLSVAFGCPFEGEVDPEVVVGLARRAAEAGADEIAIADSIGVADPRSVGALIEGVGTDGPPLRCHFHNTRNTGIANAFAAYEAGVRALDSSVAGIGGCPFAPAATGNVATEDLVYMFERMGVPTGIDLEELITTARWLSAELGTEPASMVARAGGFPGTSG